MKVFISVDFEGINGACCWDDTEQDKSRYPEFQEELQREVNAVCRGAIKAGATEIVIKDAHDSARNLKIYDLPECSTLIRGWEGGICCMMAGLDETFDCVMFVGYHSPSRSDKNNLSHTMNSTCIEQIVMNNKIVSEFDMNSLYASKLNVPVAFLSGDEGICEIVKDRNENITTCVTKVGMHGACMSKHPKVTEKELEEKAYEAIKNFDKTNNIVPLANKFDLKIQYKHPVNAYKASFFPGCKLIDSDTIEFKSKNYYDILVVFKFLLQLNNYCE